VELKPGMRLRSAACETEVVVIRSPKGDLDLTCCGVPLVGKDDTSDDDTSVGSPVPGEEVLIGKRYSDESADLEVLCTKPGSGPLACDGRPLTINAPKPLPSSD
jgi:hypothetical protein